MRQWQRETNTAEDEFIIAPEDMPLDALDQLNQMDEQEPLWGVLTAAVTNVEP